MKTYQILPAQIQQAALGLLLTAAPAVVVGFALQNLAGAVGTFVTSAVFMLLMADYQAPQSIGRSRRTRNAVSAG